MRTKRSGLGFYLNGEGTENMAPLHSTDTWKPLRRKKSVALSALLAVLAIGALWYTTDGFSTGQVAALTSVELAGGVLVGGILGLIDLYMQTNEQLQRFQNRTVSGVSVGFLLVVLFSVIGAIFADELGISLALLLISFTAFLGAQFVVRTYYAFGK